MSKDGWIKLHRKICSHWLWREQRKFSRAEAWLDLLMQATHTERKQLRGARLIILRRGEVLTTQKALAHVWNWHRETVGEFLKLLKRDEMIDFKTSKGSDIGYTLITICNYERYQRRSIDESDISTDAHAGNLSDIQPTFEPSINKNSRNEKKKRTPSSPSEHGAEMAQLLSDSISRNIPNRTSATRSQLVQWAYDADLINRRDGHSWEEIRLLLAFSQSDPFWKANILSMGKLRKQWNQLAAKKAAQDTNGKGISDSQERIIREALTK